MTLEYILIALAIPVIYLAICVPIGIYLDVYYSVPKKDEGSDDDN